MAWSVERILFSPPPITLLSVLAIVDRPAARMAQHGSSSWLFTGRGAMMANTIASTPMRSLCAHAQRRLRLMFCKVLLTMFVILRPPSVAIEKVDEAVEQVRA